MPRPAYQSTFRPNTEYGQGFSQLVSALFPAKPTDLELSEAQAKNDYYAGNAEQSRAMSRKAIAEAAMIEEQANAMRGLDPILRAGGGNAEVLAKAIQQMAETTGYNSAAQDPSKVAGFGMLQAAKQGDALYGEGDNNTAFGLFNGAFTNEQNQLNQAEIEKLKQQKLTGNYGSEVAPSVIGVNKSAAGLNSARAATEGARQQNLRASTNNIGKSSNALVETYIGNDANGNPIVQLVPKNVNTLITKPAQKAGTGKVFPVTIKDANNLSLAIDELFNAGKTPDGQSRGGLPLDPQLKQKIIGRAAEITRTTGNQPAALSAAIAETLGNNPEQSLEDYEVDDGGWFGSANKARRLKPSQPKAAIPLVGKPSIKPIPDGWTVKVIPDA